MKCFLNTILKTIVFLAFLTAHVSFSQNSSQVFKENLLDYLQNKTDTDVLLIQKNGKVIFEYFVKDWDTQKSHELWSVTKSLTNMLVGIAVHEKKLSLDESLCDKLTEYKGSPYCQIKVIDILNHSSGIKWNEVYEKSIVESSPISMLYGKGALSTADFVLSFPHILEAKPGTRWMYSSGDTNLLTKILQKSYSKHEYDELPWKKFAEPLGIDSLTFEQDKSGAFVGASFGYLNAEDALKWGSFLLKGDGTWKGHRVLPKDWIKFSTEVPESFAKGRVVKAPQELPGRHFWPNRKVPALAARKAWKDLPEDFFAALGHWGQMIGVLPSENLVVVRFGSDKDDARKYQVNKLMHLVREFDQNKKLPESSEVAGNPELVSAYKPGLRYNSWWPKLFKEVELFSNYRAKDYCSCLYVFGQSDEYCEKFVENKSVPSFLAPVRIHKDLKEISVNKANAHYVSKRFGCVLD